MTWKLLFISTSFYLMTACGDKDDNGPSVSPLAEMTIGDVSKFEGNDETVFTFKVRLNKASDKEVMADFATVAKSAMPGSDFVDQQGMVTFSPGEIEQNIDIQIVTDTLREGDEEFEVLLSNPVNAILTKATGVGTIRNDDTFLPVADDGYITPDSYAGYDLTWRDEFDGTQISAANWTHELGNHGWGNNELQNYTASPSNSYISNGLLVIEAKKENSGGSEYSSARMVTKDKQAFQFGRIDIRAKLPEGQGIWPALWMLGENFGTVGWPACGEIDIMELVGHEPNIVHGTAHWGAQGQGFSNYASNAWQLQSGKFSDEFHVFSLIWEQNSVKWYVDDKQFMSINQSTVGSAEYRFNQPFFFIFNIAVGGNWPGSPNATTVFPQRMFVDYVRVFQK